MPWAASSWCTRSTLALSLSILLIATMIGTFAARAWWMASIVWGITPSSAATTSTTRSVTWAPLARMAVDGDDGRSLDELARVFVGEREQLLARGRDHVAGALGGLYGDDVLARNRLHSEAELVRHDLGGGEIDDLVDVRQDLGRHELLDDLDRAHAELVGQVLHRQGRRQHGLALAVGLDLDRDRGGLEGRAGSLDRPRRQWRGGILEGHPPLLEKVHQLFLADPKFACEFVCLHARTYDYAAQGEFETSGGSATRPTPPKVRRRRWSSAPSPVPSSCAPSPGMKRRGEGKRPAPARALWG